MNLTHFGSCFETIHVVSTSQLEFLVTWCFSSREMLRKQDLVVDRGQLVSLFAVHWCGVFSLCIELRSLFFWSTVAL